MSTPSLALKQGVFDIVVQHAAGMQRQSRLDTGMCMYRDGKGGSCFAGALMSDEFAAGMPPHMQSYDIYELKENGQLPEHMLPHMTLIRQLQRVHDLPGNWTDGGKGPPLKVAMARSLRAVALNHGLNTELVDTHFAS